MTQRYEQLDSMRGLAALSVVFLHITTLLFLMRFPLPWIANSPLRIIYAGHEAVIFFFMLSGFVLALPYISKRNGTYVQFVIRRVFRIYIPYITVIALAIILRISFFPMSVPSYPRLPAITTSAIIQHAIFLGQFNYNVFDGVVWSLVDEMRISLVFPLIMLTVIRIKWYVSTGVALGLSVTAYYLHHWLQPSNRLLTNYSDTLHYAAFFFLGAILAKHRVDIVRVLRQVHPMLRILIIVAGICMYTNFNITYSAFLQQFLITDWGTAVGAFVIMACVLSSVRTSRVLVFAPIKFLGKISYSLYLVHIPIILSLDACLDGVMHPWVTASIAIASAISIATVSYYLVEKPSMQWGRTTAKRIPPFRARQADVNAVQ